MSEEAPEFGEFEIDVRVSQLYILAGGEGSRDDGVVVCGGNEVWGKVLDSRGNVLGSRGRNLESQLFLLLSLSRSFLFEEEEDEPLEGSRVGEVLGSGPVEARLMLNMPMVTPLEGCEKLLENPKLEHERCFWKGFGSIKKMESIKSFIIVALAKCG
jgi:hypothetical protein